MGQTSVVEEEPGVTEANLEGDPVCALQEVPPPPPSPPAAHDFDRWYADRFEQLVRLAYLLVGSSDVARDLTQDAMVRVLRKWRTIEDPDRYARRAVVNACNSHHRRRALIRRHPEPDPGTYELPARELTDALAQLTAKQRAVLVLRYWGDLPEAEIAEVLGMKRGTVASHLHRAHARLKETIER